MSGKKAHVKPSGCASQQIWEKGVTLKAMGTTETPRATLYPGALYHLPGIQSFLITNLKVKEDFETTLSHQRKGKEASLPQSGAGA